MYTCEGRERKSDGLTTPTPFQANITVFQARKNEQTSMWVMERAKMCRTCKIRGVKDKNEGGADRQDLRFDQSI